MARPARSWGWRKSGGAGRPPSGPLLALLLRFIQPVAGTIAAGGTALAEFDIAQWRSHIAWVPQRPHLFAARRSHGGGQVDRGRGAAAFL
jgi:ABC-type transport system involved in Fe-S cluster assembly fused permease/ATPase subunit